MAQCHKRAFVNHPAKATHSPTNPHGPLRSWPEASPKTALFRCHLWGGLTRFHRQMSGIFCPHGTIYLRRLHHSRLPSGFSLNVVNAGLPSLRAGASNFLRRNPDRYPDPADLCRLQEIARASASKGARLPQPKPTVSALVQPPGLRFAGLPAWLSAPPPVLLALRAAVPLRRCAR